MTNQKQNKTKFNIIFQIDIEVWSTAIATAGGLLSIEMIEK